MARRFTTSPVRTENLIGYQAETDRRVGLDAGLERGLRVIGKRRQRYVPGAVEGHIAVRVDRGDLAVAGVESAVGDLAAGAGAVAIHRVQPNRRALVEARRRVHELDVGDGRLDDPQGHELIDELTLAREHPHAHAVLTGLGCRDQSVLIYGKEVEAPGALIEVPELAPFRQVEHRRVVDGRPRGVTHHDLQLDAVADCHLEFGRRHFHGRRGALFLLDRGSPGDQYEQSHCQRSTHVTHLIEARRSWY